MSQHNVVRFQGRREFSDSLTKMLREGARQYILVFLMVFLSENVHMLQDGKHEQTLFQAWG